MITIIHQRPHLTCNDCLSGKHTRKRCRLLDKYTDSKALQKPRQIALRKRGDIKTLFIHDKSIVNKSRQKNDLVGDVLKNAVVTPSSISLNLYPCEASPEIQLAMQYYFEMFAFSVHPQKQVPVGWKPKDFFDEKFQSAMTDPMWFHANIAFSEAMRSMTLFGSRERSKEILSHSGQAVIELRKRLTNDAKTAFDEKTILTITTLMSADLVARDVKQWRMHIEGLEQIVNARGGLDSLTPYTRHKVLGFNNFWLYKQMSISMEPQQLVYPKHPFSPELCASIAKMPHMLSEMAVSGKISTVLAKALGEVSTISKRFSSTNEKTKEDLRRLKCLAYELDELHCLPNTPLEQLIIAAVCDYCMAIDGLRGVHWLLVGALQVTCSHLLFTGVEYDEDWCKVQIWAAAMLVACGEEAQQTVKLGVKVLEACMKRHTLDRKYILEICESILWDEVFSEKLDQNFDYDHLSDCPPSKSPYLRIETIK